MKKLKPHLQQRFYDPKKGSRRKEWDKLAVGGSVKVWRGAQARALRKQFADRTVTTRWHDKWKDMGEDFVSDISKIDLEENDITKHQDAKSRWIMQGFTDPDIAFLNRTVPTPASEDLMLALQLIASIQGEAGISDVSSAFGQSIKGLRGPGKRLFAEPPEGGLPGEDDDVLVELLTEIYGLVSGPPGWRRTLLSKFKDLEFSRHPLAPCVMLMYETFETSSDTRKALRDKENTPPYDLVVKKKSKKHLSGVVVIETDDLLFGGVGPKYHEGIKFLRASFKFGSWHSLKEAPKQYGGVVLKQMPDYGFEVSMARYFRDHARPIRIDKGPNGKPRNVADLAKPGEVTGSG